MYLEHGLRSPFHGKHLHSHSKQPHTLITHTHTHTMSSRPHTCTQVHTCSPANSWSLRSLGSFRVPPPMPPLACCVTPSPPVFLAGCLTADEDVSTPAFLGGCSPETGSVLLPLGCWLSSQLLSFSII